jgi:hypothetical protein
MVRLLVVDVERRAEVGGQLGEVAAADVEMAVRTPGGGVREEHVRESTVSRAWRAVCRVGRAATLG